MNDIIVYEDDNIINMTPKQIMISQPRKGLTETEWTENRLKAISLLEASGCQELRATINATEMNTANNKFLYMLSMSLKCIATKADGVYFLEGWENITSCKLEHQMCLDYSIPIYYEPFTLKTS